MKFTQNKSGFTLLELIIVIIILGIVTSLAVPRFVKTTSFSRSEEATKAMSAIRESMERCYLSNSNTYAAVGAGAACGATMNSLDIDDPGTLPGASFTYAISAQGAAGYVVTGTSTNAGAPGTIVLTQAATGVTRTGTGSFVGIK